MRYLADGQAPLDLVENGTDGPEFNAASSRPPGLTQSLDEMGVVS
jgi:hypothetical protein